jgi:FAD:protein FMN transferase
VSTEPLTKKRLATIVAGLFILLALIWFRVLPSESTSPEFNGWVVKRGETMGTTYTVKYYDPDQATLSGVATLIEEALDAVNRRMSTYRPDSELSMFNTGGTEPVELSPQLYHVMQTALAVSDETGGAFDITVGPIVNAYGFGPDLRVTYPTDEALDALRPLVGREHLLLDETAKTLTKDAAGVYCDLSAIAKGYGVDQIAEQALSRYENYFVEVGGEVRCKGVNPDGQPWRVGVEEPIEGVRAIRKVIGLRDRAMATSGDYRNFVDIDGQRVSHTIDPRTGCPAENRVVSATVLHASCERADAYATALMVLGEAEGLAFAEKQGLAVLLLVREDDGSVRDVMSSAFATIE